MVEMDADAFVDATEDELIDDLDSARRIDVDSILDSLVPQSIDWRETVRRHPFGSVACISLVGYLVGRSKGASIMTGITAALSAGIMRQLSDVFEGEFFDF